MLNSRSCVRIAAGVLKMTNCSEWLGFGLQNRVHWFESSIGHMVTLNEFYGCLSSVIEKAKQAYPDDILDIRVHAINAENKMYLLGDCYNCNDSEDIMNCYDDLQNAIWFDLELYTNDEEYGAEPLDFGIKFEDETLTPYFES